MVSINLLVISALFKHKGMPPPGCTVPPTKYNPLYKFEKFGWRKKAAIVEFELVPYNEPK